MEIPRRLSIYRSSPDYDPIYKHVGVKLNGEEQHDVVFYDMDAGFVQIRVKKPRIISRTAPRHDFIDVKGVVEPYFRSDPEAALRASTLVADTRDDAAHERNAQAKRKRKAEKRIALANRNSQR